MSLRSFLNLGALGLALVATAVSVPAGAAPISALSNDFNTVSSGNSSVSGSTWFTSGFSTGTNTDYLSLTGVKLSIANSGTSATASPVVRLFSGVSNPTTQIAVLTGTTISNAGPQTYTFSPSSVPLALTASTNYWVVLSAAAGEQFSWYVADDSPVEQNTSGYAFLAGKRSLNGGTSWSNNALAATGAISVEVVQPVPEPSTIVLAGIGVAGAVVVDRSRRRRRRGSAADAADDCSERT
jgi:hypothetical protein